MIAAFTSARSDWYLLEPVLKKISPPPLLFAGHSHYLKELGETYENIDYPIDEGMSYIRYWLVDRGIRALILLGDRYETFQAAFAAHSEQIPIVHIHAGEQTPYSPDNAYRTCITALASLCFAPTSLAAEQVRRINPQVPVLTVGAIGAEIAASMELFNRQQLESLGFHFGESTFLVTWNPQPGEEVSELIQALQESGAEVIWTYPGADPGYKEIIEKIEQTKFQLHRNLGQKTYLSLAKQCTAVVGNSSSGFIEVPSIGTPVLNIGKRQEGRIESINLCTCDCKKEPILANLTSRNLGWFRTSDNPYYQLNTIQTIATEIMRRYA